MNRYPRARGGPVARGRGNWRNKQSRSSTSTIPSPKYGELIDKTTIEAIASNNTARSVESTITESQYVASFSWLKGKSPSIVIPGLPPRWAPLKQPEQLQEDSGTYYRDINAAHYPNHPIEPALRAVLAQAPHLKLSDIDVFACGSTLGNILRLARNTSKPFRFIVECHGETVFLVRRENSPDEIIPDVYGYGHAFPEAYTELDEVVKAADSHQRVIKYDFAGFQCLVRYEVDGYLPEHVSSASQSEAMQPLPQLEGLKMLPGGQVISQKAIFDIKTRSILRQLTPSDVLSDEVPRLWLRQIPNFVLAYHRRGVFEDIQVQDVRQQMRSWESDHRSEIQVMSALLAEIVKLARRRGGQRFEVCSTEPGILEYREIDGEVASAIPEDMARLWKSSIDDEDDDADEDSEVESGVDLGPEDEDEDEDEERQDYTMCSERCGYCGRCKY